MRQASSALVVFCGLVLLWLGVTGRFRSLSAAWRIVRDDAGGDLAGAGIDGAAGTTNVFGATVPTRPDYSPLDPRTWPWPGNRGGAPARPGVTPGTNIDGGASRPAWGGSVASPPINGNGATRRTLPPVDPAILARIFGAPK